MTSLYKVLQKAIPSCSLHHGQAQFYNIDQHSFVCQQCIDPPEQTFQSDSISQNQESIFTLKSIVTNPILLMLRQNSFLSQISPETNKHHVEQFLRILTDIDSFVKTKKSTLEWTKQFMSFLKQSIATKIDEIISKAEQNLSKINQIEDNANYLKRINTEYYNQFLETLEQTYVNGTTEELNQLLKKFSIQNQNPFRRIDQKVLQITQNISELTEINFQNCLQLEKNLLDPYIWSESKLFVTPNQYKLLSKKQESVILPNTFPYLLGFRKENQTHFTEQSFNESSQIQRKQQTKVYVQCSDNSIEILIKDSQNQDDFITIDTFQCKDSQIDMMYELPQKILMTVSYSSINLYSYQFNKVQLVSSINSIKGCSEVLIFRDFCAIMAQNSLYQIRYGSLQKAQEVKMKISDTENVTELHYLFENQMKKQDTLLVKVQDRSNGRIRNLKLKLF